MALGFCLEPLVAVPPVLHGFLLLISYSCSLLHLTNDIILLF